MLSIGTRVIIRGFSFEASHIYGRKGTVVSAVGDRRKVLLDKDKDRSKDPLQLAWWFYDRELEEVASAADCQ